MLVEMILAAKVVMHNDSNWCYVNTKLYFVGGAGDLSPMGVGLRAAGALMGWADAGRDGVRGLTRMEAQAGPVRLARAVQGWRARKGTMGALRAGPALGGGIVTATREIECVNE